MFEVALTRHAQAVLPDDVLPPEERAEAAAEAGRLLTDLGVGTVVEPVVDPGVEPADTRPTLFNRMVDKVTCSALCCNQPIG